MDEQAKKVSLRAINYGLFVLTAADGDELAGAGVNWLSQASFSPPLIMTAVKNDNHAHQLIDRKGSFAVNVLGKDDRDVAMAFFRSTKVEGDTINGYRFERGPTTGAPLLLDLPYWFEVQVTDAVKRGDHTVFVGEVTEARGAGRVRGPDRPSPHGDELRRLTRAGLPAECHTSGSPTRTPGPAALSMVASGCNSASRFGASAAGGWGWPRRLRLLGRPTRRRP